MAADGIQFTKLHGLGNDYVYVSLFDQQVDDAPALARVISDRHRGVGSDGLILLVPSDDPHAHVRMIMYNSDGSRAQMCGNGLRCLAKLAYERGLTPKHACGGEQHIVVATDAGRLETFLTVDAQDRVTSVRVDMGEPILEPARIPVAIERAGSPYHTNVASERPAPPDHTESGSPQRAGVSDGLEAHTTHIRSGLETANPAAAQREGALVNAPLVVDGQTLRFTAVSMGNPHAVFFVDDLDAVELAQIGPKIEHHPAFPQRVNVHFVHVNSAEHAQMKTWERGTGITQACGTGACAVCVAGVLNNLTARSITATLPGGDLVLEWKAQTNHVFKTGPAEEVFTGVWPTA